MITPIKLRPGDRVAAVTPSWGGPAVLPSVYERGKKQIEVELGLQVVEMPHTCRDAGWLYNHPQARADDLMQAFTDPSIQAIFSAVGGDEAVRVLPLLDLNVIRNNPKIFLGFSDMTTIHMACYKAGLSSFYGPSIMVQFSENGGILPATLEAVRRALFVGGEAQRITHSPQGWVSELPGWMSGQADQKRKMEPPMPWRVLQGKENVSGHLLGGCFETLECLKGTSFWPTLDQWKGAILFLETYDAPSISFCESWLRNYGSQGILQNVRGILFGRPGGPKLSRKDFDRYDDAFLKIAREFGLTDLPMMSRLDFGHTDPQLVLPYGRQVQLLLDEASILIEE